MNEYDDEPYVEPMGSSALIAVLLAGLFFVAAFWMGIYELARLIFR